RALYSFTNTSGSDRTLDNVMIGGNLGSDETTLVQATSDADSTLEDSDLWFITSNTASGIDPDPTKPADTPVVTISRNGTGAASVPTNGFIVGGTTDSFANRYTITVPANSTARILVFAEINKTISDAKTCAKDFETLDDASNAGLLTGLTAQQQIEIVNYDTASGTSTVSSCIHTGSSGGGNNGGGNSGGSSGGSSSSTGSKSTGALSPSGIAALLGLLTLTRVRRKKKA
ncbi:MAG TPA: LPXTG cell wall anchor domain-containing protein, partial [Gammaproteobacteria bacterium]|nr:LPXTG cell wall anchor domain-containing protein [Gammaproteobacteria bacterium]